MVLPGIASGGNTFARRLRAGNEHAFVLFVVEGGALEGGYPIQTADLREATVPMHCARTLGSR